MTSSATCRRMSAITSCRSGPRPPRPKDGETPGTGGKIRELMYDCFGNFEGFVVETCSDRHVFRACEKAIEEVVLRACKERMTVTVVADPKDCQRPLRITLRCCG